MPTRVFLSHASIDKPFVRQLAAFLRQDAHIQVWLDEAEIAPGDNIVSKISAGLESEFVLFILSPASVASNWVKEEWTDAFFEQTNNGQIKLAGVLYQDCAIPRLIRNKKYFDLRSNHPEGFRQILTWLLTERPAPPPANINLLPTRPPLFIGREADLETLRNQLQPGTVLGLSAMAGCGKTTLALAFAHRYQTNFESVYWLPCQSGDLASIAGDLTKQLNTSLTGDINQIVAELKLICGRKRCLLILDNVEHEEPAALIPGGQATVLVTTRQPGLQFLRLQPSLRLELFTEEQCFELFRQVLGANEVASHESDCRKLFTRVGHLPLAVNVSASLIKYDVRYTIASLAATLPADVIDLITKAIVALPTDARRLLTAMSACAPEGSRLSLAASLIGLDETASLDALSQLVGRSLVEELNRDQRRYRLHALVRKAADGREFAQPHSEAVHKQFKDWETDWKTCEQDLPEFQLALNWAMANQAPFTEWLAFYGYTLTQRIGRLAESFEICEGMSRAAEQRNDKSAAQAWFGNQALILKAWGRLEEALALHKKQEALCLELGNKDGLQACYGNQALILQAWGRLEEALALHKKKEALCLELGNKNSLSISYGNQALILQAWGRLEEALALHKKEEALCLELGNKDGLSRSYGNQALILKAWGRLEEALALHKKQEALCLELGNKDGLSISYGNQALILKAWGRLEEALALHKKQEALCLELGNKNSLQISYGNQALILKAWGRLEEALALHKKEEALCLELGNKDGLSRSYGNQALILKAWGRLEEALALHKKQEALCLELGNKDGLSRSYGNQAVILQAWGRLEEALALHKKEEALCLELGSKSGLGYCYWNWGLLARARKDSRTEHEKLVAALALFTELKMPRERDAVAAELSKARSTSAS